MDYNEPRPEDESPDTQSDGPDQAGDELTPGEQQAQEESRPDDD